MKKNNKLKPNTLLLLFAILTLPMTQSSLGQDAGITLNWKDADIRIVVEAVSEATGKNFILDPRVTGKVNLLSAEPMSKDARKRQPDQDTSRRDRPAISERLRYCRR
jgi:type II secretory pathway component GspD/PulD (secretin)